MNVALVGLNFGLRCYLPVIKKIKNLNLKIICSRSIKIFNKKKLQDLLYVSDWKKVFQPNIDIIILALPPKIQEEILLYNLKFKKKIIFEKPISSNFSKSQHIINKIKKKKIKSQINLTYLNHELFKKVKLIIERKTLGEVLNYYVKWSFVSQDLNKKVKSWKTNEEDGGGIKNIFLTHILSYCEYFFGPNKLVNFDQKNMKFKNINYKKFISCSLINSNQIKGKIIIFAKNKGYQNHLIKIKFTNGFLTLFTKSKDWTKNFILKIYFKKNHKVKFIRSRKITKFSDGRCNQIYIMLKEFLKMQNYNNINLCLKAEKINNKLR
jgi:predicted dehydrogenase